jgi:hypothetical protein
MLGVEEKNQQYLMTRKFQFFKNDEVIFPLFKNQLLLKVKTHMNRLKLNMIFSNFFIDTYF